LAKQVQPAQPGLPVLKVFLDYQLLAPLEPKGLKAYLAPQGQPVLKVFLDYQLLAPPG
jgi:hypothetical protein